jgi:predicted phage-related endonuclease
MNIERIRITDRESWLKLRAPNIGASEVASIMGHGFESPLEVYERKLGVAPKKPETEALARGRCMEATVFSAIKEFRPEWEIVREPGYFVDKDLRFGCTPDGFIRTPDKITSGTVQCKTVSMPVFKDKWLQDASDPRAGEAIVPPAYVLQCQSEMLLAQAEWCVVPIVVFDAYSFFFRHFELAADPGVQADITTAVAKFWKDFDEGRHPEVDLSRDLGVIKRLYPQDDGTTIDWTDNVKAVLLANELQHLRQLINTMTKTKDHIETTIRAQMEGAQTALLANGQRLTLKLTQTKGGYREPSTYRTLRIVGEPADVSGNSKE